MEKMIMDDEEYISLCYLFQTNVKMALGYCETLLTENYSSTFDNFIKEQISKSNPSSCQAAWSSRRIVIHCKECAISSSSCICLNCYNKEDHKNHHISVRLSTGGNCSCGNPLSWKEEGFCQKHHAPDPSPETTQLTKELCDSLLIIFSAAFLDINFRAIYQPSDFIEICKWTKKMASVNDGYRRCIVIALLKKSDFNKLLLNIDAYSVEANNAMADLFMSLLCDKFFIIHFAQTCYKLQIDYVQMYLRFMRNDTKPKVVKPIINLTSHAYNPLVFTTILRTFDFDWIILIINFFQIIVKLLTKDQTGTKLYTSKLDRIASNVLLLAETGITMGNKSYNNNLNFNENASNSDSKIENNSSFLTAEDKKRILLLFNSLITSFTKIEGMRPFTFLTPSEKTDFAGLNTFNRWISQLVYFFENTISPLFGDLVFTSIFRYFINFFIPDKFDHDKKIPLFKRSIRGTALFSPVIPNHLFMSVLLYKNRTNLPEFLDHFINGALSLSDFTLLLSILPTRWLVACHSSMTHVIPVASRGINYLVKNFMIENMIIYSFSPTFSLVQTCFGLMPNTKEPFINVLSHLYSLYDASVKVNGNELEPLDDSVKKNQRFAFLFMIVCLMTDQLCFERDIVGIGRAMLSVLLFSKPTSVSVITKTIAPICLDKMSLSDELDKIAERVTTKKGNLFKLKQDEEKKCHPFRPWMKISNVINHMSLVHQRGIDCFDKGENESENGYTGWFPQIRKSENGLSFANALETPTLKMWIYIILRDCLIKPPLLSIESCDIIINLLIEMAKPYQDKKEKIAAKGLDPIKIMSYDELRKVISEQCQDFYVYMQTPFDLSSFSSASTKSTSTTENENGTKVESHEEVCFLSIVDIINKLGNGLFKSSLEKMGIKDIEKEKKESAEEEEIKRKQREKAKMLRDKIKNEFKMRMKNFTKNSTSAAALPMASPKANPDPITKTETKSQNQKHHHHHKHHHSKDKSKNENDNDNENGNTQNENENDEDNDYDYESSEYDNIENHNNDNDNDNIINDDDDDIDNKASTLVCNICNIPYEAGMPDCKKDDELCYPCLAINTIMPSLIGPIHRQPPVKQICLRICPHIVHASCCQLNDKFRCPVDRMRRNCLLPRLDHKGYNSLSSEEVNLIRSFKKNPLFFTRTNNQFECLVDSFICSIVIDEVRLRMLPGCLDGSVNYLLLRNLFLMLWHSHHDEQMTLTSDKEAWDPFKSLISKMIVSNDPKKDFIHSVNSVSANIIKASRKQIEHIKSEAKSASSKDGDNLKESLNSCLSDCEKELFLFLRRATLFEKLPLSDSAPSFIDWDEELSSKSLAQRFFFSDTFPITRNPSIQLDMFSIKKLPHEFLDLAKPPFNIPIDDMSSEVALCLLTGKLVSMERIGSSLNDLAEHLEENCLSNATLLLMVRGKKTSALYLAGKQFNMIRALPGIYVDKFGDEDIGFERGELLFLSEERLERYTDILISGEWTDLDMPD